MAANTMIKALVSGAEEILPKALALRSIQKLWRDVVKCKDACAKGIEVLHKRQRERLGLLFWSRWHLLRLERNLPDAVGDSQVFAPKLFPAISGRPCDVDPKASRSLYLKVTLAALATELHKRNPAAGRKALSQLSQMPPPFGDWSKPEFCADDWIDPADEVIDEKHKLFWELKVGWIDAVFKFMGV